MSKGDKRRQECDTKEYDRRYDKIFNKNNVIDEIIDYFPFNDLNKDRLEKYFNQLKSEKK